MQGIDGIETTRRLKRILPGVHVIILSVFDDKELMAEAAEAGAAGHVTKGVAGSQLCAPVLSVCGMSSRNGLATAPPWRRLRGPPVSP